MSSHDNSDLGEEELNKFSSGKFFYDQDDLIKNENEIDNENNADDENNPDNLDKEEGKDKVRKSYNGLMYEDYSSKAVRIPNC